MKRETSICSLLGLTQQDAAMVMGVHPSQWSMYESGKRSLPVAAMELLAVLLKEVQTAKSAAKDLKGPSESFKMLERLLKENQYQQEFLKRKMHAFLKGQEANARVQAVVDFFSHSANQKTGELMSKTLLGKGRQVQDTFNQKNLVKLELKQEMLAFEKQLLESRLREFTVNANKLSLLYITKCAIITNLRAISR